jgi:hypothetical protein
LSESFYPKENVMSIATSQNVRMNERSQPQIETVALVEPVAGEYTLRETQHLRMHDATGWNVKAVSGILWITQESDSRDIVLKPGDSFLLDRPGDALVSSLGDAKICFKQAGDTHTKQDRPSSIGSWPALSAARALFS